MAPWKPIEFSQQQVAAFADRENTLRSQLAGWTLNRDDPQSPKVSDIEGLQEVLQQGYAALVAAFREYDTKENLPEVYRTEQYKQWARPAAELLNAVRQLLGDESGHNVASSVIGMAVRDYHQVSGRGVTVNHDHVRALSRVSQGQGARLNLEPFTR